MNGQNVLCLTQIILYFVGFGCCVGDEIEWLSLTGHTSQDLKNGDCSFEVNMCDYYNEESNLDWQWLRKRNNIPDRTLNKIGEGMVTVEDTIGVATNDDARLASQYLPAVGNEFRCLTFWYRLHDKAMKSFRINMREFYELEPRNLVVWEVENNDEPVDGWLYAQASIYTDIKHYFTFEVEKNGKELGFLAVDDILFTSGNCSVYPEEAAKNRNLTVPPKPTGPPVEEKSLFDCDFEDNQFCLWDQIGNGIKWTSKTGPVLNATAGPKSDHTKEDTISPENGHYIYLAPDGKKNSTVKLRIQDIGDEYKCLSFWYQMWGLDIDQLFVHIKTGNETQTIWRRDGNQTTRWLPAHAKLNLQTKSQVVFEVLALELAIKKQWIIALDDITFSKSLCPEEPSPFDCDFDDITSPTCLWHQNDDSFLRWEVNSGASENYWSGPEFDHTHQSPWYGFYAYILPDENILAKAHLISESIPAEYKCLTFWYHMWGEDINTLNVHYKMNDNTTKLVWTRKRSQGENWLQAQISLYLGSEIQIMFEALSSADGIYCNIAIDDISLSKLECPVPENFCDFEDPAICGYTASKEWVHMYVKPNSVPKNDHTFHTDFGHYMMVNNSRVQYVEPTLTSLPLNFENDEYKCIRMWYYITDSQNKIFATNENDGLYVFEMNGLDNDTFSSRWQVAEFSIYSFNITDKLIIGAYVERGSTGVIAVDDITIKDGFCGFEGHCNFETGDSCSWHNDIDADFEWIVDKAFKSKYLDQTDHTLQNDQGLLMTYSYEGRNYGDSARLYSQLFPEVKDPAWRCLRFWFQREYHYDGTLQIVQNFQNGKRKIIWQIIGNNYEEPDWIFAKVPFINSEDVFFLEIESIMRKPYFSALGIDDILISDTNCSVEPPDATYPKINPTSPTPTTPTTTETPYPPIEEVVDCSFNENFCSWFQPLSANELEWKNGILSTDSAENSNFIPPRKEYSGNTDDMYLYIQSDIYEDRIPIATLQTPDFWAKGTGVTDFSFRFWYFMFGSNVGNLSLSFGVNGQPGHYLLWKAIGSQVDIWQEVTVTIPFHFDPRAFQYLVFDSEVGTDGVMALDEFVINYEDYSVKPFCNFELSMCGWSPGVSPLTWEFQRGSEPRDGPPIDHTTLSPQGTYVGVKNRATTDDRVGQFVSPYYGSDFGTQCLTFWYYTRMSNEGQISVRIRDTQTEGESDPIWIRYGDRESRWHLAMAQISVFDPFQIVIEARFHVNDDISYVAIDDLKISPTACDLPGSCSFDDGLCGYANDLDGNLDSFWLVGRGRTHSPRSIVGPPVDASESKSGFYAYADLTSPIFPRNGVINLRSDEIVGSNATSLFCLSFSYIQMGEPVNFALKINSKVYDGDLVAVWQSQPAVVMFEWEKVVVAFNRTVEFDMVFSVERINNNIGFVGLDEIQLTQSSNCDVTPVDPHNETVPESKYFCDFENGFTCSWTQNTHNMGEWMIKQGRIHQVDAKDVYDHTKKNFKGHYLFADYSFSWNRNGSVTKLYSYPIQTKDHHSCLTFWYFLYGEYDGWLTVDYHINGTKDEVLWSKEGNQGDVWKYAQIMLTSVQSFQIVFSAQPPTYDSDGIIAIDDISVILGPCPKQKMCTFDDGHFCDFSQSLSDNLDWSINEKPNKFLTYDHTLNSEMGKYIYFNTSGRRLNDVATIMSPAYPELVTGTACLTFWFHMAHEMSLLFIDLYETNAEDSRVVATFEDKLHEGWVGTAVHLDPQTRWQVAFRGSTRNYLNVNVAIDDVEILPNNDCTFNTMCDFETDSCLWQPEISAWGKGPEWKRSQPGDSFKGGPLVDHTYQMPTGYFMGLYEDYYSDEFFATLKSGIYYQPYRCLTFWLYASQEIEGKLTINLITGLKTEKLREFEMTKKGSWILINATLPEDPENRNFRLEILAEGSRSSYVALDDIRMEVNTCDDSSAGFFTCKNQEKNILVESVCDFFLDCTDGSDEINCGSCDFENGMCNYTEFSEEGFQWQRITPTSSPVNDAPKIDMTFKNESGHYMISLENEDTTYTDLAVLVSPIIQKVSPTCHLSFWMYPPFMDDSSDFRVHQISIESDNDQKIFHTRESPAFQWQEVTVYIGSFYEPFMLTFEKASTYTGSHHLALDDINFNMCEFFDLQTCGPHGFKCNDNRTCVDGDKVCDFNPDCSDRSDERYCDFPGVNRCDFEGSLCEWENIGENDWFVQSAAEAFYDFEPQFDHTKGKSGSYAMAKGTFSSRLASVIFKPSSNCTMTFYYLMYFDLPPIFNIVTRNYLNGTEHVYMSRSEYWGQFYLREEITFSEKLPFQVILEVLSRYSVSSVAVDDIYFNENCKRSSVSLNYTSESSKCKQNQFECSDSQCINSSLVCDFHADCENGRDEENCGICKFLNSSCGWDDISAGMFRWTVKLPAKHSGATVGKERDVSADLGYITIAKTSGVIYVPPAIFASPVLGKTATSCSFKFSYQLDNEEIAPKIMLVNKGLSLNKALPYTLNNVSDGIWKVVVLSVGDLPQGSQIMFQSKVKHDIMNQIIRISNISFPKCSLKDELNHLDETDIKCDFTNGFCSWYQEHINDELDWQLGGRFAFMRNYREKYNAYTAQLKSPLLPPTSPESCLTFSYFMFGKEADYFNVYKLPLNGTGVLLWNVKRSQGLGWKKIEIGIQSSTPYQIIFEGIMYDDKEGTIGLTDTALNSRKCVNPPTFCNFEADTCGWNGTAWQKEKAGLLSIHNDHTSESSKGYVLWLGNHFDRKYSVWSPRFDSYADGSCFQLNYYIQDDYTAESYLQIIVHSDTGIISEETVLHDIYGDNWEFQEISIPPNTPYQVELIGFLTTPPYWDETIGIAVDDIKISSSVCQPIGSCNFETHMCGWSNKEFYREVDWIRGSGETPTNFTGPKTDHTTGTEEGYYMFVSSIDGQEGDEGYLESPLMEYPGTICFSFYYYMYGKDVGSLTIEIKDFVGADERHALYSISGNQGPKWRPLQLEIQKPYTGLVIQIKASLGIGQEGDMAIDDISVLQQPCALDNVFTTTPPTEPTTESTTETTTASTEFSTASDNIPKSTHLTSIHTNMTEYTEEIKTVPPTEDLLKPQFANSDKSWIAGVVIAVLCVAAILGLYIRKQRALRRDEEAIHINPAFDGNFSDNQSTMISLSSIGPTPLKPARQDPEGIANPLYE